LRKEPKEKSAEKKIIEIEYKDKGREIYKKKETMTE
jgi:hypothetical protein